MTQYSWIDGTYYSGQKSVTNYNSKSRHFQDMNNRVVRLDQTYVSLSDEDKALWDTLVPSYSDQYVCGCNEKIVNGKKLFRLVNWLLPIPVLVPPIEDTALVSNVVSIEVHQDIIGGDPHIDVFFDYNPDQTVTIVLNLGRGMSNPQHTGTETDTWLIDHTDPDYSAFTPVLDGGLVNYCLWGVNGYPLATGTAIVTVFP